MARLAMVLCVAILASSTWVKPDGTLVGLIAATIYLEYIAVRRPFLGIYSASPACTLAICQSFGGTWASLAYGIGTVLRQNLKPSDREPGHKQSLQTQHLPVLLCCLLTNLVFYILPSNTPSFQTGPGGTALAKLQNLVSVFGPRGADPDFGRTLALAILLPILYWICYSFGVGLFKAIVPDESRLTWLREKRVSDEMLWTALGASVAVGQLRLNAPLSWCMLVLLPITHQVVRYGIYRLQAKEAVAAIQAVQELQLLLARTDQENLVRKRHLAATVKEKQALEEMTQLLSTAPNIESACQSLVKLVKPLCNFQSIAIFQSLADEQKLTAVESPHGQRASSAALLKLREEVVLGAVIAKQPRILIPPEPVDRIFSGELIAIAIPLDGFGAFYLGRPDGALTNQECQTLIWLSAKAAPLLETLWARLSQFTALRETQALSQQLQGRMTQMASLLNAGQALQQFSTQAELMVQARDCIQTMVEHQSGEIWLKPEGAELAWGPTIQLPKQTIVTGVVRSRRPLLAESPEDRSTFLCVPIVASHTGSGQRVEGAILIHSFKQGAFEREQQDLIGVFAQQLGLALANALYLSQIIKAQSQLVQNAKMTAVGQLAAGVAHELNTPLGAIALTLESAMQSNLPASLQSRFVRAEHALDRSRAIIEKLMFYSQLQNDQRTHFDLSELCRDTLDFFQVQLAQLNISVERQLEPSCLVFGSMQEIQQLLTNILMNAKESYAECDGQGAKSIWVQCRIMGSSVEVSVVDQGCGVPQESLSRAFEPFYTTKVIGQNTGLGLSVSLEVAQRHSGSLELVSLRAPDRTMARLLIPHVPIDRKSP